MRFTMLTLIHAVLTTPLSMKQSHAMKPDARCVSLFGDIYYWVGRWEQALADGNVPEADAAYGTATALKAIYDDTCK